LLIELESEGLTAWGECVAGEHPYFSDEMIDTAWIITETELAPRLLDAEFEAWRELSPDIFKQVRGHRMAKAALENAVWDLEAQVGRVSLPSSSAAPRASFPAASPSASALARAADGQDRHRTRRRLPAHQAEVQARLGHRIFEAVRNRWPDIMLSCDANSAYRMKDFDHIASWDSSICS
jgi:O-succinylbenzoate synthase